jgi:membrane protein YqaA with SNARE-associated domain
MQIDQLHVPHWLQPLVAWLGTIGGVGLFIIGFLDSSFLTFPVINDLLVVELSIRNPSLMPYYALMATMGSLLGCAALYLVARKGGEALFRRRAGQRAEKIRRWVQRNGFMTMLVTALLPPPTPFKFFVLGAAVFEVPFRAFTLALLVARSLRYFIVGFLAIRYGRAATAYMINHKFEASAITLGAVAIVYVVLRLIFRAEEMIGEKSK